MGKGLEGLGEFTQFQLGGNSDKKASSSEKPLPPGISEVEGASGTIYLDKETQDPVSGGKTVTIIGEK